VVNLFAKWKRGEAQEMQQTRDKQRVDFPRGLVFLHTMCRSRGDSLKVLQKHPFERLNISSGDEAAEARVRAVRSSSLFFYPSNVHLDCFEVRFFDKKTSTARYERFFASVDVSELDNYIIIAAEMDDAARLHPATLSLDDPGMFWSICFRLEACYSHLKKCSPEIASAWECFGRAHGGTDSVPLLMAGIGASCATKLENEEAEVAKDTQNWHSVGIRWRLNKHFSGRRILLLYTSNRMRMIRSALQEWLSTMPATQ